MVNFSERLWQLHGLDLTRHVLFRLFVVVHHLRIPLYELRVDNLACLRLQNNIKWDVSHHDEPERKEYSQRVQARVFDTLEDVFRAGIALHEKGMKGGK